MGRIIAIGKIRHCSICRASKVFFKESNGNYHCETCGTLLVERSREARAADKAYDAYCQWESMDREAASRVFVDTYRRTWQELAQADLDATYDDFLAGTGRR